MTFEDHGPPEFAVSVRGYDRLQVDDYVAKQAEWLQEACARTENAERELAACRQEMQLLHDRLRGTAPWATEEVSTTAVGERVGQVLEEAREAAEAMRAEATAQAQQLLADARQRASATDGEAERARAEAERLLAEARAEAEAHRRVSGGEATSLVDTLLEEAQASARAITAGAASERRKLLERAVQESAGIVRKAHAEHDEVLKRLAAEREARLRDVELLRGQKDEATAVIRALHATLSGVVGELDARAGDGAHEQAGDGAREEPSGDEATSGGEVVDLTDRELSEVR